MEWNIDKPYIDLHIDWTDLKKVHAGFIQVMLIHDTFSGRTFLYFMTTHGKEKETLQILKDFILWICFRYNLKVNIIRSDNKLKRKKTLKWLQTQGITFKPLAPHTQAQNGTAKCSESVIIEKAHAIKIAANLPYNLWNEIVNCVVYL